MNRNRIYLLVIVIAVLSGALTGYIIGRNKRTLYTAELKYVFTSQISPPLFDVKPEDLGGAASIGIARNAFTGNNLAELTKSKKVIRGALKMKVEGSRYKTLAQWVAAVAFSESFPAAESEADLTHEEQLKFHKYIDYISHNISVRQNPSSTVFYYIRSTLSDPELPYYVVQNVLSQLNAYYKELELRPLRKASTSLNLKRDSVEQVLRRKGFNLAQLQDRGFNLNESNSTIEAESSIKGQEITASFATYNQILKSLGAMKYLFNKDYQLLTIIDEPQLPLEPERVSISVYALAGGGIALIISATIMLLLFRLRRSGKLLPDNGNPQTTYKQF